METDDSFAALEQPFAGGITMLLDRHQGEEEKLMEFSTLGGFELSPSSNSSRSISHTFLHCFPAPPAAAAATTEATPAEESLPEPNPPEPFEYPFTD